MWSLLEPLTDEDERSVRAAMRRRKYPRGQFLVFEGELGDSLHVIAKGRVAIRVNTTMGEVATLAVLGPGESFGEQALVTAEHRRTASAVALEPVETLTIDRVSFESLCRSHPGVMSLLIEILAAQVRRLSGLMTEAYFLSADQRVLRRLAALLDTYGITDEGMISVTQDDLASMAGTTRPTANRALQPLAEQGIVRLHRGGIEVLDRSRLEAAAR